MRPRSTPTGCARSYAAGSRTTSSVSPRRGKSRWRNRACAYVERSRGNRRCEKSSEPLSSTSRGATSADRGLRLEDVHEPSRRLRRRAERRGSGTARTARSPSSSRGCSRRRTRDSPRGDQGRVAGRRRSRRSRPASRCPLRQHAPTRRERGLDAAPERVRAVVRDDDHVEARHRSTVPRSRCDSEVRLPPGQVEVVRC